jgi:hypothetical protein
MIEFVTGRDLDHLVPAEGSGLITPGTRVKFTSDRKAHGTAISVTVAGITVMWSESPGITFNPKAPMMGSKRAHEHISETLRLALGHAHTGLDSARLHEDVGHVLDGLVSQGVLFNGYRYSTNITAFASGRTELAVEIDQCSHPYYGTVNIHSSGHIERESESSSMRVVINLT